MNKPKVKDELTGRAFVFPSFVMLTAFVILPIILVFFFSFTNYTGKSSMDFTGLKNYIRMLQDPAIKYALKNTIVFVLIDVPCISLLSLGIAALIAQNFRNKFGSFVRSTLFIPVVCSATLIGSVWYYLFSSDPSGMVNQLFALFGIGAIDWLGQNGTAMAAICFVNIWKSVGYFMVIWYAAIMDIPVSLLEAAEMDGASKFQQLIHIIIPNLKNVAYFVVAINTIWAFQVFDIAYAMTKGGPGYGTSTLIYRIYQEGFYNWKMGYACAISVMLFVVILIVSTLIKRAFRENRN